MLMLPSSNAAIIDSDSEPSVAATMGKKLLTAATRSIARETLAGKMESVAGRTPALGGGFSLSHHLRRLWRNPFKPLRTRRNIPQILENPFLRLPRLWTRIFTGSVWSFRGPEQRDNMYRPLQFICYWVLYRLKGPNPFIFHFAMLAFYAAVVWLAYRLACQLLPSALFAFAGTLLWALHPLHVETVAWISALPDMGASFFYLLAFLLFLRADRSTNPSIQGHGLAALAFLPALFFKEMALSFPILLLVYWFFLPGKTSWGRKLVYGAVYLVPIVFYSIVRIKVLGSFTETGKAHQSAPRLAEVAIALLGQHAKLFFWPRYLSLFRSFDLPTSLHSPWPWMVAISILGALLLRKHAPLAGFLISWWVVTLLPTLDVRQVNLPVADRFSFSFRVLVRASCSHGSRSIGCRNISMCPPPLLPGRSASSRSFGPRRICARFRAGMTM